jgi:hypothetical protein
MSLDWVLGSGLAISMVGLAIVFLLMLVGVIVKWLVWDMFFDTLWWNILMRRRAYRLQAKAEQLLARIKTRGYQELGWMQQPEKWRELYWELGKVLLGLLAGALACGWLMLRLIKFV